MQYNQDGADKRTMEADRAHHRIVNAIQSPQRATGKESTRGSQRHSMDLAHRRSLERFTATVSAIPDMPQAVPAMGPTMGVPAHCARAGRDLNERGKIDIREAFINGSFAPAKKKGACCRQDKAWQRHQGHGNRRRCWSSCCRSR